MLFLFYSILIGYKLEKTRKNSKKLVPDGVVCSASRSASSMSRRKAPESAQGGDAVSVRTKRLAVAKSLSVGSHINCANLDLRVLAVNVIHQDTGEDDVQLKVTTLVPALKQSLQNEYIYASKTPFEVIVQSGPSYQVPS